MLPPSSTLPAPLLSLILSFLSLVSALPPHSTPSSPALSLSLSYPTSPSTSNPLNLQFRQRSPSVRSNDDTREGGGGITLPLYHRSLSKRTEVGTKSWALREKGRLMGKYDTASGSPSDVEERDVIGNGGEKGVNGRVEKRKPLVERLGTLISTAGVGGTTTTGGSGTATSTATGTANTSLPTSPVGFVQVHNYEADLEYFASVGVGVPPQYMNVILDTGSADLWIVSTNCSISPTTSGCSSLPQFNATTSSSGVDISTSFNVKYGSGSASGEIWQDYVGFGGYNVSSQGFALCDSVSMDLLNGNISGLMGLGWQTLAASGLTPFWQNLYQAGVLPFSGFAFYLTRFNNISSAATVEPGGALSIGYLNQSLYQPPINYIPIPSGLASYWVIPLESISVGGNTTTSTTTTIYNVTTGNLTAVTMTSQSMMNLTGVTGSMVAIDTGTTLIGGPSTVVANLYANIPGAAPATGAYVGYYSFPCNLRVNVSLGFGGQVYPMTSDDFNLGPFGVTNNVSTCLGAFFDLNLSSTSKISWVIGAAFLKNVFSVFRASPPSVGFALLSNGSMHFNASAYSGDGSSNSSNTTVLPAGIYGPSGGTSLKMGPTSVMANTVTTAIQAGQTASKSIISGVGSGSGREVGRGVMLAGLVGMGFAIVW